MSGLARLGVSEIKTADPSVELCNRSCFLLLFLGRFSLLALLPLCRVSIEFLFYLNFNFIRNIEATYSIARIFKFSCNLMARKRLASTKIL